MFRDALNRVSTNLTLGWFPIYRSVFYPQILELYRAGAWSPAVSQSEDFFICSKIPYFGALQRNFYERAFLILSIASITFSRLLNALILIKPSPQVPNPAPGVITTPVFSRSCSKKSNDFLFASIHI